MKRHIKIFLSVALAGVLALGMAACSDVDLSGGSSSNSSSAASQAGEGSASSGSFTVKGSGVSADGSVFTISSAGTYVLSGTLEDGQILVKAGESDDVTLVLSGADISCSTGAPIVITGGDEIVIEAQSGTANIVSDLRSSLSSTEEYDAAIYCESDLELNGSGSLTVSAKAGNGIKSKDDLSVRSLTLSVNAAQNALKGNDGVTVESGTLDLVSTGSDGIKTSNGEVSSKGNQKGNIAISGGTVSIDAAGDGLHAEYSVEISDGTVAISSDDDAIHAEQVIAISGGTVDISESHEGLEGNVIDIRGGTVKVNGTDDGLNATTSGSSTPLINISGGYLEVSSGAGDTDAIDSNGNFVMSGGLVIVKAGSANGGMSGSVDVDGSVTVSGGTIIAFGGISDTPSSGSVCTVIQTGGNFQSGSYVLADASGNTIAEFELSSGYTSVWMASDAFKQGSSYSLSRGGSAVFIWTQTSQTVGSAR